MPRDRLIPFLQEIAHCTPLSEDDLARMVSEEVERLSADARVHDYIYVLAVKRVSDKVREGVRGGRPNGIRQAREK